jgi:hypothetical protein
MNLEQTTLLCLDLIEYIHKFSFGSSYVEPTNKWYRMLRLENNGLIWVAYTRKNSLPIYIELTLGSLKYELDVSRVVQNAGGRYSWYLTVPRDPNNKKSLQEFGLVLKPIPSHIYKEMREQQKDIKKTDSPNVQKNGLELISNASREDLYFRFFELVKYIFSSYSNS